MTSLHPQPEILLGNQTLELAIDPGAGTVTRLRSADGWSILDHGPGLSFRLLVPLPDRRHNYVDGARQRPSRWRLSEDGRGVTFEWDTVTSEHGGRHAIAVSANVRLEERRAVFSMQIRNDSDLCVENVHYPRLADVRRPAPDREFFAFGQNVATAARTMLWPRFANAHGFCSVDFPTFRQRSGERARRRGRARHTVPVAGGRGPGHVLGRGRAPRRAGRLAR